MAKITDQAIREKFATPITIQQASKDLGIPYSTLRRRMKKLKIKPHGKPFARGYHVLCRDGHIVDSFGERQIDDWLSEQGFKHYVHWKLVGLPCIIDFWLPEYGVGLEFVGVEKILGYQERTKQKLATYDYWNIPVVFITPDTKLDATLITQMTEVLRACRIKKQERARILGFENEGGV